MLSVLRPRALVHLSMDLSQGFCIPGKVLEAGTRGSDFKVEKEESP